MSDRQITIRMPEKSLAKWLKALRKGGYTQGQGALYIPHEKSFCCLGVLQHCLSGGSVEDDITEDGKEGYAVLPSSEWLREQRIEFSTRHVNKSESPYLPAFDCDAATANDDLGKTFAEIADAIEACAEGV
jgi:hypothetical protein